MNIYKKFVHWFAFSFVTLLLFYLAVFKYQFGAPIAAEYWLKEQMLYKEYLARQIADKPKLVIISGSNSLFGIDSSKVEEAIGRPVVNLSLHAGMPFDWLYSIAKKNTIPGDTVIMPLEWGYYFYDYENPSEWTIDQVISWAPDYFNELNLNRKLKFVTSISPLKLYTAINANLGKEKIYQINPNRKIKSLEQILEDRMDREKNKYVPDPQNYTYQYFNSNVHGDLVGACLNINIPDILTTDYGIQKNSVLDSKAMNQIIGIIKSLESTGRNVYVTFPGIVINNNTQADWYIKKLEQIVSHLKEAGIRLVGTPQDHFFEPKDFFDSKYHLNCEGKQKRTDIIIERLLETPSIAGH